MYPGITGKARPDHPAVVMAGSGDVTTHGELDRDSGRLAQYLYDNGLRPGSHIAVLMENVPQFFTVVWAAMRSGLYVTPVNRYLPPADVAYILEDSGAAAVITSPGKAETIQNLGARAVDCSMRLCMGGPAEGLTDLDQELLRYSSDPLADEPLGSLMFYSSGTTGRPKGIKRPLPGVPASTGMAMIESLLDLSLIHI